jgi:hypothetical protein
MRTLVALRLVPLLVVAVGCIGLALNASATTSKAVPYCGTGQKSTTTHPCVKPPKCKTGQKSTKAHPCVKPTATSSGSSKSSSAGTAGGGGTSSASSGSATAPGSTSGAGSATGVQANGCPAGQTIPQGTYAADGDEDNTGGADDGDGCY